MRKKVSVFDVVNNTILTVIAVICIYPFLYILFQALSDGIYVVNGQVSLFPRGTNLEAFKYVLSDPSLNIAVGLRNSFLYTFFGTALALSVTFMTAYALTRRQLKGRYAIMRVFVFTWVFEAGIIPTYIIFNLYGFVNNPLVMIVPGAINTQFLLITKSFLESQPYELEDAAKIDGASDWKTLVHIYLPICRPIIATVGLLYAVFIWNQYLTPQIYLKSPDLATIQLVLKSLIINTTDSQTTFNTLQINGHLVNPQNLKSAATFLAMLPIVCAYPFVQKYLKSGILIGSVKG